MVDTKERRTCEIYEEYWKITAAHLNIHGVPFNNCLNTIIFFIDEKFEELKKNANRNVNFSKSNLYKEIQDRIVLVSDFKGSDADLSARKVINQFVKLGFIKPMLLGYHPLTKSFIKESDKNKKKVIFSKIFYENSSLASDVTKDNTNLNHIRFLLQTLEHVGCLNHKDITALMVTDIQNFKKGYLTKEELVKQYNYAVAINFLDRKYNQISHLIGYLKRFVDLRYDQHHGIFTFNNEHEIIESECDKRIERDGIRHRIFREELKNEPVSLYGQPVCYLKKRPYKSLVASHIKPCVECLKQNREDQAYDYNNGLLLSPDVDAYFDKNDITFSLEGNIVFGSNVDEEIVKEYCDFKLDSSLLTKKRKEYLVYHNVSFLKKHGNGGTIDEL